MARNADGLGLFGAWLNPRYPDEQRIKFAAELEDLGFRTIWLGGGRGAHGRLGACTRRRCARREATIVPAIIRVWSEPTETVAQGYRRIHSQFGDRFLLGIGVGHPETQSGTNGRAACEGPLRSTSATRYAG